MRSEEIAPNLDPLEALGLVTPATALVEEDGRFGRVEFSSDLREAVLAGDITVSFRIWRRAKVKAGGRYRVGPGLIEVEAVDLMPFAAIGPEDVVAAGEYDRESLRRRAAHAGPITDDTMLYRIEFHAVDTP